MSARTSIKALFAVVAALAIATPASASFVDWLGSEDERVELGETRMVMGNILRVPSLTSIPGDVYAAVRVVNVGGLVGGDLSVVAEDLDVDGTVNGDLNGVALRAMVSGQIDDDVRLASLEVLFDGRTGGDVIITAAETSVLPGARVGGALVVSSPKVTLRGRVDGPVRITAGLVELDAVIGSNAWIECDVLKLGPGARIDGDLVYDARNEIVPEPGVVGGEVTRTFLRSRDARDLFANVQLPEFGIWFDIYLALVSMLAGTGFILFFKPLVDGSIEQAATGPGLAASFGIGLVATLVMLVLGILCALPLLPLALGVWSALGALLYFGGLIGKMMLGCLVLWPLKRARCHPLLGLFAGVVVMLLVGLIPVVGSLFWIVVTITGMGATLLQLREGRTTASVAVASMPAGSPPPPRPPAGAAV